MLGLGPYKILLKTIVAGVVMVVAGFKINENKPLVVENAKAVLVYHLAGGKLIDFHLKENPLNPFLNSEKKEKSFHLEINREENFPDSSQIFWDLVNSPIQKNKAMEFMMKADFLKDKITVKRFVKLANDKTGFQVREDYFNYDSKEKRVFFNQNIPLNEGFITDAKVYSNIEVTNNSEGSIKRKDILKVDDGAIVNWVVIANSKKGLLMGFVWRGADYSKIEIERKEGILALIMGESDNGTFEPLESKGIKSKKYFCFLLPLTKEFTDVSSIQPENGKLIVKTNAGKRRYEVGDAESP